MVMIERPILRGLSPKGDALERTNADAAWAQLASLYDDDARLDQASLTLIRNKNLSAYGGEHNLESFSRAMNRFQRTIAEDTVRNTYNFETTLHRWFCKSEPTDLRALNERIYAELFLTPSTDPWLGLLQPGLYSGIEDDGIRK
jgi:hypothetical protein